MHGYTPSTTTSLLWLIPLFPLIGAAINGFFGHGLMKRHGPKVNHTIAVVMPTLSFIVAMICFFQLIGLPENGRALHQNLFPFIHVGLFDADLAFWFDPLSATLTLIITLVGTLIHIYSIGYMKDDPGYWRFFSFLNLFMGMMLLLALGDNFMVMFIGWEGVGLCSFLLISFWYTDVNNAKAGMKAFVVNRVGDFAFVLALGFLFWGLAGNYTPNASIGETALNPTPQALNQEAAALARQTVRLGEAADYTQGETLPVVSLRFDTLREIIHQNESSWRENSPSAKMVFGIPLIVIICILLFIAATGKSAQIPLYVWLPDAMAGPTPVSGLIHAATMVTAGVYMVARLSFMFALSPTAMSVVAMVGALTAFFAATIGLFQYDIKKVLAYSTVSQLGYMFIGVGVGAYWAGVYHLLTHALFKACLFLGSGSVILGCHHEQDMRKMGGLKKYMPKTHWTYFIACVMITTAPIFILSNGFYSKDEILWKAFDAGHLLYPGWILWIIGAIGALFTSFYMWRSYYMTFTGEYRGNDEAHHTENAHDSDHDHHHGGGLPHESPLSMTAVLITLCVLAVASIGLGFWPLVLHNVPIFEHWLHPVVGEAMESLHWLSQAGEHPTFKGISLHTWEYGLAAASILITMTGWFSARLMYKDNKSTLPTRILNSQSGLVRGTHNLVFNKYFIDEIYDWAIVKRVKNLSVQLANFDQKVLDAIVNFVGRAGRLIGIIDGWIDSLIVDGMVNGVASFIAGSGDLLRRTQTGRIQTYLIGAVGGTLVLVLINFVIFFMH